ncbi:MAG: Flp family type IVb pilin [Sinomonas sp.]|jgi:pilus assembly protein Flp/PilA|nr:Flp family type IVb pilin [Sinomonas sp.]
MNPQDSSRQASDPAPDECGATATEYVMLVAFISLALVGAVTVFGTALNSYYISLANVVTSIPA